MPRMTLPGRNRGRRNQAQSNPAQPAQPTYPMTWQSGGNPEPVMPPANPLPVPQGSEINLGNWENLGGGMQQWSSLPGHQSGGGKKGGGSPWLGGPPAMQQPSSWDMRNWFLQDAQPWDWSVPTHSVSMNQGSQGWGQSPLLQQIMSMFIPGLIG